MPSIHWLAETLEGKTLGLVGMGDIAREFAKKAAVRLFGRCRVSSPMRGACASLTPLCLPSTVRL